MKRFITLLFVVLLSESFFANAQQLTGTSNVASGKAYDENNNPLAYATISLMQAKDSSLVKTSMTDTLGMYSFKNIPVGNYFITISMTGYKAQTINAISIGNVQRAEIPSVQLKVERKSIAAVTVTAKRPFVERKIDRTIINVESSVIAAGSTALEVLEKAPGVLVDKDGNISMAGKSGVLVMIDGKQTYMSHAEIAQLLRTMQSSQLETIELITNPSAKYDASGNAGIINIKTKKMKTVGTNGSVNIGSGYGDKYKGNAGINLNHRTQKINVFGNYNFGKNYSGRILNIDRLSRLNNEDTYFNQHQVEDRNYENNNFKAGADFFINSNNTIGVLVNGYANNFATASSNITTIGSREKVTDSLINVVGDFSGYFRNIAFNMNYRSVLDSTGKELTVDIDYSSNHSSNLSTYDYYFIGKDGRNLRSPYLNRNTTPSVINIKSAKIDYVWPVTKSMKVEAGLKSSIVCIDNDLRFEELNNSTWENNSNRSNHFIYDETIHAGYLNASKEFKNTSVQMGVRVENTISKGNSVTENKIAERSYFDWFPSLFVNHTFSTKHQANFSYSRRIDRPGYDALNPFVYYVDQYTFQKGNPFLNPQYTHSFEVGYTFKRKYSANFRYALTTDNITDVIVPDTAKKALFQTAANVDNANYLSLTINAPVTVTKWWNANNTVTIFNNQYRAQGLEGLALNTNKTSVHISTNHSFTLPNQFAAEVSGSYTSSNVYGTLNFGSNYGVDLGLGKSLMKKKANLKFSVSDVLNTRGTNIHSTLNNFNYKLDQKQETRVFRLSFSYRFGSSSIKEARHRSTGLESEQSRIKS
jgi:outer membrane receptor protein involved in Fe transport